MSGLSIISGEVDTETTAEGIVTSDTFLVRKAKGNSSNPAAELAIIMETVLNRETSIRELFSDRAASWPEQEAFTGADVVFQTEGDATRMYLAYKDRIGLLFWLTGIMADLKINIIQGHIETKESGEVADDFYLQYRNGPLPSEILSRLADRMKARIRTA